MDRVVIISLAHRQDRRQAFRLPADWPWPQPTWFRAIDGRGLPLPAAWGKDGPGAYGCALSHIAVLEQAMTDQVHSLLVLEDDAVFCSDFGDRVHELGQQVPDDWAMLMLGGQHLYGVPNRPVVRCKDTQRTHAYAVRGPAIELLAKAFRAHEGHVDGALPAFQSQVPTYAPCPFLVGQAAGGSDVDGLISAERFWN